MSFFKVLGSIGKTVGGVALGLGSGALKTATGGLVDVQGAIQGAKNTTPVQAAQGSNVEQPSQTGTGGWFQGVVNTIVDGVNSMNPHVTVSADQTQTNSLVKYGLIAGAGLLAFTLLQNNKRS